MFEISWLSFFLGAVTSGAITWGATVLYYTIGGKKNGQVSRQCAETSGLCPSGNPFGVINRTCCRSAEPPSEDTKKEEPTKAELETQMAELFSELKASKDGRPSEKKEAEKVCVEAPPAKPVLSKGGYVTLSSLDRANKKCDLVKTINSFVGKTITEANEEARLLGYTVFARLVDRKLREFHEGLDRDTTIQVAAHSPNDRKIDCASGELVVESILLIP